MSNDRTSEFLTMARSLPGSSSSSDPRNGGSNHRPLSSGQSTSLSTTAAAAAAASGASASERNKTKNNPAYTELRAFHRTAADISRDIASTSALLTELTTLVRNKSLFEDDNARVNRLVVRIKGSIENLNSRLDQAGVVIAQQKRRLGQNSQAGQEASNLVDGLKNEFAQAASGFKKVLQQRTDSMKETDELQKKVYGAGDGMDGSGGDDPIPTLSSMAPPPVFGDNSNMFMNGGGGQQQGTSAFPTIDLTSGMMAAGEATGSGLPRPHGISGSDGLRNRAGQDGSSIPTYSGAYSSYNASSSGAAAAPMTPLDIQRMEEESGASQMMQLIPDQSYLEQRAEAMSTVETNIVELGTIFNKLAVMVSEHQEMVQRVEDNVEEANSNINLSLGVLTDTLANLKSNRALAFRLFSILVVFIIAFIIFFA